VASKEGNNLQLPFAKQQADCAREVPIIIVVEVGSISELR
jgi:hypothetical protein